jgi:predicted nuclease with RNAse H fold
VLTLGVDLASADDRTAMALVEWAGGAAVVRELRLGVSDPELIEAIRAADKAGLDCPLGWPVLFTDFVAAQRTGSWQPVAADADWRRGLAYRVTDLVVRAEAGVNPLSVSADRIAYVAFRGANLLAHLAAAGISIDRSGAGRVVEVYPAASLRRWGLTHRGYKRPGQASLVDELREAAPWLDPGEFEPLCRTSHDAFDALTAALATRAAALCRTLAPTPAQQAAADAEGWIALPTCDLAELAGQP